MIRQTDQYGLSFLVCRGNDEKKAEVVAGLRLKPFFYKHTTIAGIIS